MSVAGRLVVGLAGAALHPLEADWLRQYRPAGVILFARNVVDEPGLVRLIVDIRACLGSGAEVCADHEGGAVSFLAAVAGRPPAARTLGDLDDPDLTERAHAETAGRLRDLGLTRVLAPCCDVLTEPRNPVIGARAFGATKARVTAHAGAAAGGLRRGGLQGCVKHWPGHGGTDIDTHERAADLGVGPDQPFHAALAAGVDALMVGHLPARPGAPPLSVDQAGLAALAGHLGPDVTIWSDDISMGALRPALASQGVGAGDGKTEGLVDPARLGSAWLEAVAGAGCDRLLLRGIPWRALPLSPEALVPLPGWSPASGSVDLAACWARSSPAAREARRRVVAALPLRLDGDRLLWCDATAGERLGEARALEPWLRRRWPRLVRLDTGAPRLAPQGAFGQLLLTSTRPLSVTQAGLLEPLLAATGEALVAGHPSLAPDLSRLAGPGWTVGALRGHDPEDLAPLVWEESDLETKK